MKDLTLYHFIEKDEFDRVDLFTSSVRYFYLPTEFVFDEPSIATPMTARAFRLDLLYDGEELLDYRALYDKCKKRGLINSGTSDYDRCVLLEMYADYGDDGHIDYLLDGYVVVLESDLPKNNKYPLYCISYSEVDTGSWDRSLDFIEMESKNEKLD